MRIRRIATRIRGAGRSAPLAVGMMHGLAGSAALVVLTLETIPSVGLGVGYIALFGVGSIAGMALLSVAIAVPLKLSSGYLTRVHRAMTALVGVFSCVLGVAMVVQIGYLISPESIGP